ncbi:hypothetical protein [Sphaerisporangium sp. TRM90804]|uniref:NACHT and WD40 repeat domain-containing protein n=1 Tax=Sphaerisporangium sp. TRM90804 TaxID=3031113 RepID=UPI002446AC0A|nr:hypothetical protein [Sphaerisporangium sp. TRM90804]MDH2428580.1 hypothetical protein [Sphaerisporangium sp. TRM90804]
MSRPSRRALRLGAALVLALSFVALAIWMASSDLTENDSLASILSLFVGLIALGLTAADFLRGDAGRLAPAALADDLASTVEGQWLDEARARGLRDLGVLPLSWSATERDVSDRMGGPGGRSEAGRVLRMRLDGRLEGSFEEATRRLAARYRQVRSGRLVILGEPGSGKSVLAVLLTLGLLDGRARETGAPVPVLLAASSWDPLGESMDEWVVRTLATSYYSGRTQIARLLHDRGLLLPIVDGLDEIPESARRSAVRAIGRAIGRDRPVVVTCRSAEYEDVIAGGVPALRRAPVVEVAPVPAQDVIGYLKEIDWPDGTDWGPVHRRLLTDASSPVATALSTPLMVSMARRVYQRCGGDPAELLDEARFDCRHAVEDHVIDRMVDAAYTPEPPAGAAGVPGPPPGAAAARRHLIFLARYLHHHRERDLAWWLLSRRLLSPWVAPGIGLLAGGLSMALLMVVLRWQVSQAVEGADLIGILGLGAWVGGVFSALAMVAWYIGGGGTPGGLSFSTAGSLARLRRGFGTGVALTAIPAIPALAGGAIAVSIQSGPWSAAETMAYWAYMVMTAGLAVVVGLALAVHNWLHGPPSRSTRASPLGFLRQDRRSSLVGAVAAGAVLAVALGPGLVISRVIARIAVTARAGWSAEPSLGEFLFLADREVAETLGILQQLEISALLGVGLALLILLTRAWPRFALARLLLAAQGRLPWRLLGFLAHAREQELLRQSGGVYQFRHIRVQEWLATQPLTSPGAPERTRRRRRVLWTTAAAGVAALISVSVVGNLPRDDSRSTVFAVDWGSFVLSEDGSTIVRAVRSGGRGESVHVHSIDTRTGGQRLRLTTTGSSDWMVLSADGAFLAVGTTSTTEHGVSVMSLWEVASGRLRHRLAERGSSIDAVLFSPRRSTVAVASSTNGDEIVGTVRLVDLTTGQTRTEVKVPGGGVGHLEFSPDGGRLAIRGFGGPALLWDTAGGRESHRLTGPTGTVDAVVFSPDGAQAATTSQDADENGSSSVILWDTASGRELHRVTRHGAIVHMAAYSPDGTRIAIAATGNADDGRTDVDLCDAATGRRCRRLTGHPSPVHALAFNPDGSTLATGDLEGVIRLWDTATGRQLHRLTGHTDQVSMIRFHPGGSALISQGEDRTVRLWDLDRLG